MSLISNDISKFDFDVLWDLSQSPPKVIITNMSEGLNLGGCEYWFEVTSGGGVIFHQGIESSPDKSGVWSEFEVPESIPQILGHIEWSGSNFKVKGYVKDSDGNIFDLEKTDRLCRPTGNDGSPSNNFGKGALYIEAKCEKARLWVEDRSNYSYNGNAGTLVEKTIKLIYPEDPTGATPAPRILTNVNSGLIPISFSAPGYQIILTAVYQYVFSNGDSVRIKYKYNKVFAVQCNVDLCPLISEIERMRKFYKTNGCNAEEREKMILINLMLTQAMMAKMQPLCGFDLVSLVEEIKKLGGFTCSCTGDEYNGINEVSGTAVDCDTVLGCLNTLLNQITPNCLDDNWENLTLLEKLTIWIEGSCCSGISDTQICMPPISPVQVPVVGVGLANISWTASPDTVEGYEWVLYKVSDNSVVDSGSNDDSDLVAELTGLVADTDYRFEVRAKCGTNNYSNFVQLVFTQES